MIRAKPDKIEAMRRFIMANTFDVDADTGDLTRAQWGDPSEPRPLADLLRLWPEVIATAPEGWPRNFALAIQKARRKPEWQPSDRQLIWMRLLVAELISQPDPLPLFNHADGAPFGELQLIED